MRWCVGAFLVVFGSMVPAWVAAQDKMTILSPDQEPRTMLRRFLLAETQKHFDARKKTVAALKTPDDIHKRQAELKAKFIAAIGGFPKKTPLKGKVVGTLKGDGFVVENVIYESRPNHHVTANFYIPNGKGPFPGVLVPCGHSSNGKAADAYQRVCILMARNGLAVLCYDPIGQGERLQLLDSRLNPDPSPKGRGEKTPKGAIRGSTSEHTMVGVGALLVGQSTAGYRIWDGIRSIDYLVSRPEVDPKRIGCTGNSGGGTLTAYLMALDDRIVCAAPSCYITSLERLFATIGPQDAEQNIPGQVAFGMEHADYVTLRAPRPTLICMASQDFFDQAGTKASFAEAEQIYKKLGHGERVGLFEYDDKHGFSKPRREAAMRWMRRWLLNKDDAPSEGKFPSFKDEQLQCTRSGQVLADFKGVSAFGLNLLEARKYTAQRAQFAKLPVKERQATIRRLLAVPEKVPTAKQLSQKIHSLEDRLSTHKVVYETEKGILLPGLRFKHIQARGPVVLYFPGAGLPTDGKLPAWLKDKYEKNHQEIWMFDLRGLGETAPGVAKTPGYFGVDQREAWLSLHLARPLLGQRVLDVLALMNAIAGDNVEIIGVGTTGPVVLHAAALNGRIREVTLEKSLRSWMSVVEQPISFNQLTNVAPGVLKAYDLPDLERSLSPRKVIVK
ncbi:MAG: acetylxylan esterase [Planctomycetes bacterium]|nr:acetylxylan esterase [Planctomycetota bacterium]